MPIYEYSCQHCGTTFEVFVRNGEKESGCPECGHTEIKRLLSPVYSNFTSWSDTLNGLGKWSTKHEDFSETADGR